MSRIKADIERDLANARQSHKKAHHRVEVARRNLSRHSLWLEKCITRVFRLEEEWKNA